MSDQIDLSEVRRIAKAHPESLWATLLNELPEIRDSHLRTMPKDEFELACARAVELWIEKHPLEKEI